jgi:quercetin dioxygenase-like cupin family protein
MRLLAATAITLSLLASAAVAQTNQAGAASGSQAPGAQSIRIMRRGSQAPRQGPTENFTGSVSVDPLFQANTPARASGSLVTFEPGARTAWHIHPLGQTLIVASGLGWAQREGGPIEEIRPGDVVWFAPNEKHWHGATPTTALTHIAIQEALNGKQVEWTEHVTDEQYQKS